MTRGPVDKTPRQWLVRGLSDRADRRALTVWRPPLHPVLKRSPGAPPAPSGPLWPYLVIVVFAIYAAAVAEVSGAEWPLYILVALPVVALAYDWWSRRGQIGQDLRRKGRPARILADHRPVLMRRVLILPDQRPARIVRNLEPRLSGPRPVLRLGYLPPKAAGKNLTANVFTNRHVSGELNGHINGHLTHLTRGGRGRIVKRPPTGQ